MTDEFKALMIFYALDMTTWTRYLALDDDGSLWAYSYKPEIDLDINYVKGGCWSVSHQKGNLEEEVYTDEVFLELMKEHNIDWEDTMVKL